MKCLCGHQFVPELRVRERTSFAVIPDAKYGRFLASERKIREASTREESLKAIAKSARLVGSLRTCPACARLVFVHPGGEKVEYYQLETVGR
jgi:hypothetical protein